MGLSAVRKKNLAACVYPKSLSSVSVRDSFLVTLTDVCSHKSCFIKRFCFLSTVSLLLIFNTNKIDENI